MSDVYMFFSAVINKSVRGFFLRKGLYCCGKVGIASTLFSGSFDVLIGYRVQTQTKNNTATRPSVPCGKCKCQTGKNLCTAYTQVNSHTHFFPPPQYFFFFFSMKVFHTEDAHLWSSCEPPWHYLLTSPRLLSLPQEVKWSRMGLLLNLFRHTHTCTNTKRTPESTLTNSLTSCG